MQFEQMPLFPNTDRSPRCVHHSADEQQDGGRLTAYSAADGGRPGSSVIFLGWRTQGKTETTGIMSTTDNQTSLCCVLPIPPARLSSMDLSLRPDTRNMLLVALWGTCLPKTMVEQNDIYLFWACSVRVNTVAGLWFNLMDGG